MLTQSLDYGPLRTGPVISTVCCILLSPRDSGTGLGTGILNFTENSFVHWFLEQGSRQVALLILHIPTVTFDNSG